MRSSSLTADVESDEIIESQNTNFKNAIRMAILFYVRNYTKDIKLVKYSDMIVALPATNLPSYRKIEIDTLNVMLKVAEFEEKTDIEIAREIMHFLQNQVTTGFTVLGVYQWETKKSQFRDMLMGVLAAYYPLLFLDRKYIEIPEQKAEMQEAETGELELKHVLTATESRYETILEKLAKVTAENKVLLAELNQAKEVQIKIQDWLEAEKNRNNQLNLKAERQIKLLTMLKTDLQSQASETKANRTPNSLSPSASSQQSAPPTRKI